MKSPLADSYGVLYIGVVISSFLFGSSVVQAYIYFQRYASDPWLTRLFIVAAMTLDGAHMGFVAYSIYYYLIESYTEPTNLLAISWPIFAEVYTAVVIRFCVQVFYSHRIYKLMRRLAVSLLIVTFSTAQLGLGTWFIIAVARSDRQWISMIHFKPVGIALFAVAIGADITIAISMIASLNSFRTAFRRTRSLVRELIVYALGTGVVTVIVSLLTLVFLITGNALVSVMLYGVLAKLYANSILVSLNTRQSLQNNDGATVQADSALRNPMSGWSGAQSQPGRVFLSTLDPKTSGFEVEVLKSAEVC